MEAPESLSPGTATRPDTADEERRLRALDQYDVLDAPPTEAFDRITRLATRLFDVPVALVNVVDRENQWSVSSCGLDLGRTPLDASFCVHTIDQGGVMVVEDARADDRFADNPLVTGPPHVRFYAGAPITSPQGHRLGALCLLDDEPHSFAPEDRDTLADLAGVVMDELHLRYHAADLDAARQAHREASKLKSAFLANVSHDVQTPLAAILNHADLLRRKVDEEHRERIDLIKRSGVRLRDTIESVLDLSKLEAGAVEPSPESLDLADELLGSVELFQPQAAEQEVDLRADVDEPLSATLDPTMLHRITDNLLSNALKFTEPGGTITLRAHGTDEAVTMEVVDTGVGIDADFLPNLFEAFAQGPEQNDVGGSGLGLAITKRLTEVMDGTIEVESEPGVGTTFTVRLPR
jgi:signal transduction histidine kinase